MRLSVEASLKKLRTSYIDILYLHWWDFDTSVEEVMNGLHILVQQGRVLYFIRVSLIHLPGLCPRQINTLVITGKLLSRSIKACGTFWSVHSSAT